jgi:TolB-like protein
MVADVVGYSRLMGLDEAGTARALREHRVVTDALVDKHGGRIIKTTGDGLLIEFPSVVDAVECAVAVQTVMLERNEAVPKDRCMLFRIGINLGDILIEGDDILGDGVNIAARLESIAEPGGICVSASAHDQVHGKVAVDFADLGEQYLKNIARPIRAYSVVRNGYALKPRGGSILTSPSTPHLSIVVLPFANIGGDSEQDYFVDGVTESLTTDLSRIAGAFVIARNTAFTFKGKPVDIKKAGRELNVRYVLEGSVQRSGNRLRVNVQLIDAETGKHLWAERFDKPVADIFDMQDEIVSRIANALDAQFIEAEARRAERSTNPDAMDLYFQGVAWMYKGITPEYFKQAQHIFERALVLYPENVDLLVGAGVADLGMGLNFFTDDRAAKLEAAETRLTTALSIRPDHAFAHLFHGLLLNATNRASQGITESERALALNRNLANAHAYIGQAKFFLGRGAETEAHVNEAFRLSPRDPFAYNWMLFVGQANSQLERYDEAVIWFRRSNDANRNYPIAHFQLAAALALAEKLGEAHAAAKVGLALNPEFTIRRFRAHISSDNPTYRAGHRRVCEGLRLAGIPEG